MVSKRRLRLDNDSTPKLLSPKIKKKTPKMLAAPCLCLHSQVLVFQRIKYDSYELRRMAHILFMGKVNRCLKALI